MICYGCGGSDLQGTCACGYDYPPEPPDMSCLTFTEDEREKLRRTLLNGGVSHDDEPEAQVKQICHFCGVDLFLPRTDLNIRMCVPCGIRLDHKECYKCVVCNKIWLINGEGSVCEFCKSL